MEGTELLVLQACSRVASDEYGFVLDADLARHTHMSIMDVRDYLESLEQNGFISLVRLENPDGLKAKVEAKGRTELSKRRRFQEEPKEQQGQASPIRVVPKGLHSFDKEDADFFLELLPNPGRSDKLPNSIRFWKSRIEETDPDRTFRVGLIYGPSGCGKSSLVKAGLIPRLAAHIRSVYVEVTPDDTEVRLLRELRKVCPELPKVHALADSLSVLSRGQAIPSGQKVLVVLDQFEQWLHAKSGEEDTELVAALRQCDGEHVQAIVLVRDDFWSAVGRFEDQIGVVFRSDHNSYSVALFYQAHAEKVLTAFGQAYGRVEHPVTPDQQEFIRRVVKALALRGMILPVRLALLSLVFQSREWTAKTLEEIGGVEGLEVEFFNNIFNFEYADRRHRIHQKAAQSVLGALLPKDGGEIKRPRRPWRELLHASGYAGQPQKFEDLLRILDQELFLITPIEQEEGSESDGGQQKGSGERYYQLTHDFLVPSLREWQSNKDKAASDIVNSIMNAATKDVLPLVDKLDGLRFWADPKLREIAEDPNVDSKEHLHASLALLPVDREQVEYLYPRLLKAASTELPVIREALKRYPERVNERLWSILEQSDDKSQYLQAASALALYDPANSRWQTVGDKVARAMATVNAANLGFWLDALRPARDRLTAPLATIYQDTERSETERSLAFNILDDYASDRPNVLTNLLMDSKENHFVVLFERLKAHQEAVEPLLNEVMVKSLPEATDLKNDVLTQRQAKAAVALIRLSRAEEIWPLLGHGTNPSLRSYLVNWLAPLRVNPREIASQLFLNKPVPRPTPAKGQQTMDAILFNPANSKRRALILALGTYGTGGLSRGELKPLIVKLLDLYRNDPDVGIHSAAEWTLHQWKQGEKIKTIDSELIGLKDRGERRWYVNCQGQTFALIAGTVEFRMGSPESDPERFEPELPHKRMIDRHFAIATKEVTVEQYQQFLVQNPTVQRLDINRNSPEPTGPMNGMTWYEAAAYCNWLSEKEEIPHNQWCYQPHKGGYVEGMAIPKNGLERKGYRLPTEAEWEYACRAGAVTSRYYGHSIDLLDAYARHSANSEERAWPCGNLLPNDLGLFDMLGNLYEWCHEASEAYLPGEDGTLRDISNEVKSNIRKDPRVQRGGAFTSAASVVRSAFRGWDAPSNRSPDVGFRLARTYQ